MYIEHCAVDSLALCMCPTVQVFTEHTHIVAVRVTGNVYCWEAVEELCIKSKASSSTEMSILGPVAGR